MRKKKLLNRLVVKRDGFYLYDTSFLVRVAGEDTATAARRDWCPRQPSYGTGSPLKEEQKFNFKKNSRGKITEPFRLKRDGFLFV